MDYLYNEAPAAERAKLSAHMAACPECRERVHGWQKTMDTLDTWQPAVKQAPAYSWMPAVRWAAAAVVMVGLGFALSRVTAPQVNVAAMQTQIRSEVAAEMKQQMAQAMKEFAVTQAKQRVEDQQQLVQTLKQMEAQRLADLASLRYDMESLAMSAQLAPANTNERYTAQVNPTNK